MYLYFLCFSFHHQKDEIYTTTAVCLVGFYFCIMCPQVSKIQAVRCVGGLKAILSEIKGNTNDERPSSLVVCLIRRVACEANGSHPVHILLMMMRVELIFEFLFT